MVLQTFESTIPGYHPAFDQTMMYTKVPLGYLPLIARISTLDIQGKGYNKYLLTIKMLEKLVLLEA